MSYSAAESVYREVKELILSGELPGGDLISEGEIATRMSCSRTPVREAFLRLEAEGWMRLYPKRGALVVPVADGEAEHVVDARRLLETHAVRAVASVPPARERLERTLRASLDTQRELAERGDVGAFSGADADFHRSIVAAGGNPLLDTFYAGLRERQRRMTARSVARDPAQLQKIIADHTHLVDLVAAGDADAFDAALDVHMREVHGLGGGTIVTATATEPGRLPTGTDAVPRRTWLLVAAAMFAVAWGGNEFTPLLVMYRLEHGFAPVVVDLFLFAYVLGIVPALLVGGPLSDRLGRRPVMVPAPFVALVGSAVLALGSDSAALLILSRILCGIALGLGMAVGGSWLKELSDPRWDPRATPGAGARRAAMSLTAGFGVGAGIAGALAQWAPMPSALSYLVHIGLSIGAGVALLRTPETRPAQPEAERTALREDLKIPAAGHARFLFVIAPVAPWVFGAASSAYAILPALMTGHSGDAPIAFSALLCVVALGAGFAIQSLGRRIDTPRNARAVAVALTLLVVGMVTAAVAAAALTVPLALLAAVVLGCGYGMALVSGLQEVQRIARPDDLAGLTAVFYSLSYLGFAVPAVMVYLSQTYPVLTYPAMFVVGAVAAAACLVLVLVKWQAHLPERVPA